jgi:hypothetical protein
VHLTYKNTKDQRERAGLSCLTENHINKENEAGGTSAIGWMEVRTIF